MTGRALTTLAAALASAALVAPAAHAATARVTAVPNHPNGEQSGYDQVYYADPLGEVNDVVVSFSRDDDGTLAVVLRDTRAAVHAEGPGCEQVGPHAARCERVDGADILRTMVYTGARDDRVRAAGPSPYGELVLVGGPGDDLLAGGAGHDRLFGGAGHGRDTLLGNGGDDELTDSDGYSSRAPAADVLDGGAGFDTVSYARRDAGVRVDLDTEGPAGERGEGDRINSIENAIGGTGDDRLTGDDGGNVLDGRRGDDVLIARGGDDLLTPGAGRDRFSCGRGRDVVTSPAAGEVIGRCEQLAFLRRLGGRLVDLRFPPRPIGFTRRHAVFSIRCPRERAGGDKLRCAGRLTIRQGLGPHRLLGRGSVTGRGRFRGARHAARVRLTRLGRRLVRRRGGVVATMRIGGRRMPPVAWTTRLRG